MEHDAIRVPIFCGKPNENPRDWLEKYDNIAAFKSWDDAAKLKHVPLFLDETARNWYRILDAGSIHANSQICARGVIQKN
jgi:hypothetical protein